MCCLASVLVLIGPRAAILVWWLMDQPRWNVAFDNFLWPFLGFLFVPWTTLAFVLVSQGGVDGFDWVWLGLGVLADVFSWGGGAYGNRDRVQSIYN